MGITIRVVNQKMHTESILDSFVDGSQEFVQFKFRLDDAWKGLTTFAQFMQDGVAYNQYLDENNCAYLPSEIKAGTCTLMLYGTKERTIGTSNYLTLTINENILASDASSTEISKSLYTQLVERVDKLIAMSNPDGTYFSPLVAVSEIDGGHSVVVTDIEGEKTFNIMDGSDGQNGSDGQDGADGADGFSPTVTVTEITGGHRVSITDSAGTKTFDVMNGADGESGSGSAITSVSVNTLAAGSDATASIANGVLTLGIPKGDKGEKGDKGNAGEKGDKGDKGDAGEIPGVVISPVEGGTQITISTSEEASIFTVNDGKDGKDGANGADGYTPVKGTDYWTDADKQEIVTAVLAALPAAEGAEF